MSDLTGKAAIVTGAGNGLGREYARHLATLGARVVVADIDVDGAKETVALIEADGGEAEARHVDIADPSSCSELVRAVGGTVDVLVNNAAIYAGLQMELAEEVDLDYWRRMVDVNISGTYYMTRAIIPGMRAQERGVIVNQASIAAYLAAPLSIHYATTKAAVITMTKVLSRELGEDNIRVNCIAPGIMTTQATLDAIPQMMQDMVVMNASLKRLGEPEDLLGALEFLVTDRSSYVTGQTLVVDGGVYTLG